MKPDLGHREQVLQDVLQPVADRALEVVKDEVRVRLRHSALRPQPETQLLSVSK